MKTRVPVQQQELNDLKSVKDMVISLTYHFHGSGSSEGEDICTRDHSRALGLHSSLNVVHVLLVTHPYLSMWVLLRCSSFLWKEQERAVTSLHPQKEDNTIRPICYIQSRSCQPIDIWYDGNDKSCWFSSSVWNRFRTLKQSWNPMRMSEVAMLPFFSYRLYTVFLIIFSALGQVWA